MAKIILAGSSGGHLTQLYNLKDWWQNQQRIWVTFPTPDAQNRLAKEKTIWCQHTPDRTLKDNLKSLYHAWRTLRKYRPDLIVTAGASLGTLYVVMGKLLHIPSIYIEVFDRLTIPSLSGRICYRIANKFAVQWESQKALYPNAIVIGPLL